MNLMMMTVMFIVVLTFVVTVNAYVGVVIPRSSSSTTKMMMMKRTSLLLSQHKHKTFTSSMMMQINNDNEDNIILEGNSGNDNDEDITMMSLSTTTTSNPSSSMVAVFNGVVTSLVFNSLPAYANDSPDWGLFEGRSGSLIHPIVMGSLFLFALYTAFLGLQYKRQRTIGDEISALKKSLPALQEEEVKSSSYLAIESQVASLIEERKSIVAFGPRDKHFQQGVLLSFIGTTGAIEGCLNTYSRAGKLFPGPHLYVGAALVICWGLAVATIPSMIKGNDISRKIHVGSNIIGVSLFGWQVITGLPILFKVIEITKWP